MAHRNMNLSAVMLFLFRDGDGGREMLLQRRRNTGYADGLWDCAASGHVDANESMTAAMRREAREELGIEIRREDLEFVALQHKKAEDIHQAYCNVFFVGKAYSGVPTIQEPEKCSEIAWFPVDALPADFMDDRRRALEKGMAGMPYDEIGWDASPM